MQSKQKKGYTHTEIQEKLANIRALLPYGGMKKISNELLITPQTVSKCLNGKYESVGLVVEVLTKADEIITKHEQTINEILAKY